MQRKALVLLCVWSYVAAAVIENAITIRAKRQECKCVPNQASGGLICSCSRGTGSETAYAPDSIQQTELAQELTNSIQMYPQSQARCGCLQIVLLGTPQYQCQCGDGNGNPIDPITRSTTPYTTSTTAMSTTTTTQHPVEYPTVPTATGGPGQCHCVMIRISGPASAQYQCNCDGSQQQTYAPITYAPETPTTTAAPITVAPESVQQQQQPEAHYPLTTTCVMYVGMQTSPCVCLPQYDQCAPNVCCLKARFRSHKQSSATQPHNDAEPSTVDMLMNILNKIKTKLNQ